MSAVAAIEKNPRLTTPAVFNKQKIPNHITCEQENAIREIVHEIGALDEEIMQQMKQYARFLVFCVIFASVDF